MDMTYMAPEDSPVLLYNVVGDLVTKAARACPACHTMHYFFRTRAGQTLCLHCSEMVEDGGVQ